MLDGRRSLFACDLPFGSPAVGRRTAPDPDLRDRHQRSGHRAGALGRVCEIDHSRGITRAAPAFLLAVPRRVPGDQSAARGLHLCPAKRGERSALRADRPDQLPQPAHLFRCSVAKESAAHVALRAQSRRLPGARAIGGPEFFRRSFRSGGLKAKNLCEEKHPAAGFDRSTVSALCRTRAAKRSGSGAPGESARCAQGRRPRLAPALESVRGDYQLGLARAGISGTDKPLS